jgi:hypothetical protein
MLDLRNGRAQIVPKLDYDIRTVGAKAHLLAPHHVTGSKGAEEYGAAHSRRHMD